jgi:DNA-binding NtrC family response regulator
MKTSHGRDLDSIVDCMGEAEPFRSDRSYRDTRSQFEADFERRYVKWLLTRHCGNISAAAREARMDRKHLYDLAKRHGMRGKEDDEW